MPKFKYTAYATDDPTRIINEEIEASTSSDAAAALMGNGFQPISIAEVAEGRGLTMGKDLMAFRDKVKVQELAFFTRQLSTLIGAGINVVEAIDIVERGTERAKLRNAAAEVKNDIQQGTPFSAALAKHPDVFDPLYSSLVAAGEAGDLSGALERLADMLEVTAQTRREVKSAMVYPMGVLGFSVVILIAMLIWVVPAFEGIFEQAGGNLPLPTKMLVVASDKARQFWFLIPVVFVGSVVGFKRWRASESGTEIWDRMKLKLPAGMGELTKKVITARFSRTLATLQGSGVPLLQALETSAPTADNVIVQRAIAAAAQDLQNGKPLAAALRDSEVFPDMAMSMLESGEKAGQVSTMLDRVAETYEKEVSNSVKALKSVLEPLMMVGIGGFIGVIVISLYLPMFSVYDQIK